MGSSQIEGLTDETFRQAMLPALLRWRHWAQPGDKVERRYGARKIASVKT